MKVWQRFALVVSILTFAILACYIILKSPCNRIPPIANNTGCINGCLCDACDAYRVYHHKLYTVIPKEARNSTSTPYTGPKPMTNPFYKKDMSTNNNSVCKTCSKHKKELHKSTDNANSTQT